MRVIEFINKLPPLVYSLYSELVVSGNGLQVAQEYRYLYIESGYDYSPIIDMYRATLAFNGVSRGILAALDDQELHTALTNYTLIVAEEIARRVTDV